MKKVILIWESKREQTTHCTKQVENKLYTSEIRSSWWWNSQVLKLDDFGFGSPPYLSLKHQKYVESTGSFGQTEVTLFMIEKQNNKKFISNKKKTVIKSNTP